MKKQLFVLLAFFSLQSYAQTSKARPAIIPEPVSLQMGSGSFTLPQAISIEAPNGAELQTTISFLKNRFSLPTGYRVTVSNAAPTAAIRLQLTKTTDEKIGKEGYHLTV